MDQQQGAQQREMMFCHECENEWYRHEHGFTCPECQSDFTEIIEADHDPRHDEQHIPGEPGLRSPGPRHDVADPDEDDIDNLQWEQTGPDTWRVRGRYNMDMPLNSRGQPAQAQNQGGFGQGLMGIVGNMLQGIAGQQQARQQPAMHGQDPQHDTRAVPDAQHAEGQRGNGTFVRHGSGPGFSYTIATSSNNNFGGNNLIPRNANGPQPFQAQPDHLNRMMQQMLMNVGAMPVQQTRGGMGHFHNPNLDPFHNPHDPFDHPHPPPGFMFGGPGGFAGLMQMLGAGNGIAGDAVYTQEALDRVMTQLMEQHQTGNAPGPATEAAIEALPRKPITLKQQGDDGKAECSICMDEVPLGETVTWLPCEHWFHHDCVKAWLIEHDTCPQCRESIMPKHGEGAAANTPRRPGQEPLHDMRNAAGDGSRANPFTVPESPVMGHGRRASDTGRSAGMFSRMREAFGGNGAGSSQGGDLRDGR